MEFVPFFTDEETGGFSFIWTIQNFDYCMQKKDVLVSPRFKVNLSDAYEWCLNLYPANEHKAYEIGLFVCIKTGVGFTMKPNISFSICDSKGTFITRKNQIVLRSNVHQSEYGCHCFLNDRDILEIGETILKNDILTLRCRIQQDRPVPLSGLCHARTEMQVEKISFIWPLEHFKEVIHEKKVFTFHVTGHGILSSIFYCYLHEEVNGEKKLMINIEHGQSPKKVFRTWKISLLNAKGIVDQSVRHHQEWHEADQKPENWNHELLPIEKILDNEKLFITNGAVLLLCKHTVFFGDHYSTRDKVEYGVVQKREEAQSDQTLVTGDPRTVDYNLQRFYIEGKSSDLIIRTASSKEFPVHKAILCARSEMFRTEFGQGTFGNQTVVLDIEDFHDEVVYKMLLFAYTNIVEDLEWNTALDLYSAADKYGISDLKEECHNFLKANMSSSNVGQLLIKACLFQDQEMKLAAMNFIMQKEMNGSDNIP